MFYDKLLELSVENGYNSPTAAAREIGMTGAHVSKWKKGSVPTDVTKIKFAQLFGVSPSVFDEKTPAADSDGQNRELLIDLFDRLDESQQAGIIAQLQALVRLREGQDAH